MLNSLIQQALKLKKVDERASYFIAKELALIEINLTWFPYKNLDSTARLRSLAQHVKLTFKDNDDAKELADMLNKSVINFL